MTKLVSSIETFERLAKNNPSALLTWIQGGELETSLTFALESLGQAEIPILNQLLSSTEDKVAVVREGAIYGLRRYFLLIRDKLEDLAENDLSEGVRSAAKELLEK